MSFGPRDLAAARAIVSTHETYPPTPRPNYAQLAILKDGPGGGVQVTFGAHQSTDRADSLDKILTRYKELAIETQGPQWFDVSLADDLAVYLPQLAQNTGVSCARLAKDPVFLDLLRRSASDPLMHQAQNEVFDVGYMRPAIAAVTGSGWVEPLSLAVVYDSMIHGSWAKIRDKVRPADAPERDWISRYVTERHFNMAHAGTPQSIWSNRILRGTVYRMKTFRGLITAGNWQLATPFVAHDVTVTEDDINAWG